MGARGFLLKVYLASLAVEVDSDAEENYLRRLAERLGLETDAVTEIDALSSRTMRPHSLPLLASVVGASDLAARRCKGHGAGRGRARHRKPAELDAVEITSGQPLRIRWTQWDPDPVVDECPETQDAEIGDHVGHAVPVDVGGQQVLRRQDGVHSQNRVQSNKPRVVQPGPDSSPLGSR